MYVYLSIGEIIQFDEDWSQLQYLVVTRETAFEIEFLKRFDVEILIGQVNKQLQRRILYMSKISYHSCPYQLS